MEDRREHATVEERIALGNRTVEAYNRRLLQLAAVTAVLLLALMGATLWQLAHVAEDTRRQVGDAKAQAQQVADLLERQKAADGNRNALIDDAIKRISAEQYRALVAHDTRAEKILLRALSLLDQEVNSPANRERVPTRGGAVLAPVVPLPQTAPMGPSTGVAPAPKPAPAPTCDRKGKSGKCR